MTPIRSILIRAATGVALACTFAGNASAADAWPQRPVRFVVGAAVGSAPDIVARLVGEGLARAWGQAVVVENKPGAGGNLGAQGAARAKNDGYTLWFAHATPVVMNQFLHKAPGFDADKDFVPIVRIGTNPMMVAVNAGVPAKTPAEFVTAARSANGRLSFATSGFKNIPHLVGESLNQVAGTGMVHVPYRGSQQAAADTIAGRTEVYVDAVPPMVRVLQGGQLRAIAVTSSARLPGFESVPTLKESGIDLVMVGWMALLAPAGSPPAVIARVNADTNAVLAKPEIAARLYRLGTFELGGTQPALAEFIVAERRRWESVVARAGIQRE